MADVKWIKIYTNMTNNKKIKRIRKMPEGNNIILIWVFLLAAAGESNKNGGLYLTDTIPFKEEDLAIEFDFEIETIRFALITLERYEMIEIYEAVIYIKNWAEYQNIEGLDKVREQTRQRTIRYREKLRLNAGCDVTCDATVTDGDAIDIDIDKEEELDKELIINIMPEDATENERTILNYLKGVTGYTIDYKKDLSFIRELAIDFPKANILEKIKEWNTWLSNHPLTKKSNPRLQIRNWIKPKDWGKGGSKFGANRQPNGQNKANAAEKSSTPSRSRKASEWED